MKKTQILIILILLSSCGSTPVKKMEAKSSYKGSTQEKVSPVMRELENLKNNPDSKIRVEEGWIIIQKEHTHWSFAPESHEAYPAFAKREFVEKNGGVHIKMGITCGATKEICDRFVKEFKDLNDKFRESFK